MTVDDIVDEVLDKMLEEYEKVGFKVKDPEKFKMAHERWLRMHIITALLEALSEWREKRK